LRNDYRVGVLNGTRSVIDSIDLGTSSFRVTTDSGEKLSIPFTHLEAGHLTHGYATTIHKAQGLTVDRCLVLFDDTGAREHAYTALSRGRHGNDIDTVVSDRRAEERHAAEIESDALDTLRSVAGRSAGKQLAVDHVRPQSLEELRRQRDELAARLGPGPPNQSLDYHRLLQRHSRLQGYRDGAAARCDIAHEELQQLGPVGRRIHRTERRRIEDRIARFEDEIARYATQLEKLSRGLTDLTEPMLTRSAWENAHTAELQQLSNLDRDITLTRVLERPARRTLERGIDRGLELGF
jgi:hypothetical protein